MERFIHEIVMIPQSTSAGTSYERFGIYKKLYPKPKNSMDISPEHEVGTARYYEGSDH